MKLVMCDMCRKAFPEGHTGRIKFKEGINKMIMFKDKEDEWLNIDEFEIDICRQCAYPILKMLKPNTEFLPLEKYKKD